MTGEVGLALENWFCSTKKLGNQLTQPGRFMLPERGVTAGSAAAVTLDLTLGETAAGLVLEQDLEIGGAQIRAVLADARGGGLNLPIVQILALQ